MVQTQTSPVRKIAFPILIALSVSHCLNDLLQSVISAAYPLLKTDLSLSFAQIGLITLVYQMSASVFQPITGLIFDKRPIAWSLPIGMTFSLVGIVSLAFATNLYWLMVSVFVVGIGSSVLHPEASRITFLASGGKRGLAQSLFQVGGNLGGSLGPLLVALLVAPFGRQYIAWFAVLALIAIWVMMPICRWYRSYLNHLKKRPMLAKVQTKRPLSAKMTAFAVGVLLVLIFSKYIYMASLTSYYTFYLIHKFGVTVQQSQIYLFVFLVATAAGTLTGGPIGDKVGRKFVIWISILGTAPFSMLMPHVGLFWTVILSFCVGFMLSSAFPAILLYAQELLPDKLGLISGLFFGFAFGIAGIASAVLGNMADDYGIEAVYNVCAFMPLLGLVAWFLPNLKKR
ncbi:MFS transporter [Bacteroides sp.]|uniref:MFS transporter n=1 Tax=Bacteroides sp. TaxID=29523 RepID=UPI00261624E5|nr:MFS transporter [Bacteroides sp.]